jgi:hypothetical protein
MKIHIYVKTSDLEKLNIILSDPFSVTIDEFVFSNTQFKSSTMISLSYDQWIRLNDNESLITFL